MNYFSDKILKIRSQFSEKHSFTLTDDTGKSNAPSLSVFERATADEILQIITSHGIKCSPEDPIPSQLLKSHINTFIPVWIELVNISLTEGSMECLKSAVIRPLIKEMDGVMDNDILKNYRPVSNLMFLAKLIERIVSIRLNKHMDDNNLHSEHQHGYRKGHSTETLLVNIVNDLLLACDEQKPTILMLLDLSAAFDTVDQAKLLEILHNEIGVTGIALKWFRSFLTERSQRVKIGESYSEITKLDYGVAQGSVLGPDLFKIYIRSLYHYIEPSKFTTFGFADDHQLIKSFVPLLQVKALDGEVNHCFQMVSRWMYEYFLCINSSKTKIIIVVPPTLKSSIVLNGTFIDNNCIRFVTSAKNLGVILDNVLSFEPQIKQVVKSCYGTLRKISKIKSFLSKDHLKTLVSSFIFSKIDYCNSLYTGVDKRWINMLQLVQNSAARLIRSKENQQHLTTEQCVRNYHWLPVEKRIFFKLLLIVHKCVHGKAPKSLSALVKFGGSSRTNKLEVPRSKGIYGSRAFSISGPKLWNLIPKDIRCEAITDTFKTKLKTFLFEDSGELALKFKER